MDQSNKRKADSTSSVNGSDDKRAKTKKQWQGALKNDRSAGHATAIQTGDAGIWATCPRGREGKCVGELKDLFAEYAELLYADAVAVDDTTADADSIEQEVQAEIEGLRKPKTAQLFTPVKLDVQCVVFFKTIDPVDPVSLVQRICEDALHKRLRTRTRFAQRLTPMSMMGYASAEGLGKVASQVLASSFQGTPVTPHKYAIRPNMRNHNALKRDAVIQQVASLVGPSHSVDLENYDVLILVEIYKNICGISVVTNAFDALKRFNLAELSQIDQDPVPGASGKPGT